MIENTLERIAVALEKLAERREPLGTAAEEITIEPPAETPAPALAAVPEPAPAAAPVNAVPFSTPAEMNAYVMEAYTAMGAEKGAKIANVLTNIGVQNIKEVKPEQYQQFYAGVEALKAS